jgi:hypothetical protein
VNTLIATLENQTAALSQALIRVCKKTLKQMKKNELHRYINNKMQEKSAFFPKNLAFMSLFKKTSKLKNVSTSVIFSRS